MNVDFITIGQRTIRVTSLKEDTATGALTLVVIARETADRRHLSELLAASPVSVEVPDRPPQLMDVASIDEHIVGTGDRAIARFSVELLPSTPPLAGDPGTADDSLPARLDRIEATLAEILRLVRVEKD